MPFFNTASPVVPQHNYHIPPLDRIDRNEFFDLIERWRYFIPYETAWFVEGGRLVIFDRSQKRSWDERVFRREESVGGRKVTVWGM